MPLKEELSDGVDSFFGGSYVITDGYVVPDVGDLPLGKEGRELELMTMLFIDIHNSTDIVSSFRRQTAAKMYKSFLWGVTKVARWQSGEMLSFNGDGVLIGFVGIGSEEAAARTAFHLVHFGNYILKPKLQDLFAKNNDLNGLSFDFGIGLAKGTILAVRAGMKGENNNDLVWVGNATNHAAKLASEAYFPHNIRATLDVFTSLGPNLLKGGLLQEQMWTGTFSPKLKTIAFQSNWYFYLPAEMPTLATFGFLAALGSSPSPSTVPPPTFADLLKPSYDPNAPVPPSSLFSSLLGLYGKTNEKP